MSEVEERVKEKSMKILRAWILGGVVIVGLVPLAAQSLLDDVLSPARLPYLKNSKLIQISTYDTTGGNNDFISILSGETATIGRIQGPGVIAHMWVTIFSNDTYMLRRILLRMYWDDEKDPSVEVPIGDFFGTGFSYKQYITPFLGMSSGGYYSYFPMPFNKSARIEVVNETGQEINSFYYHIDYHQLNSPLEPNTAYFHATWHREPRTDSKLPFTILEAEGTGHVVGINLNMQSYNNDMQYLEGDEMVYVDGEKHPSIWGTGTEDYFNSGWYFNKGEFAAPFHGLIIKDDTLGRIAAYRFHIVDAIPFKKSIRFTIEHGDQNVESADYSGTAYWYQLEPHKKFPPMIGAGMRIPLRVAVPNKAIEAESLTPKSGPIAVVIEDMSPYGADWSNNKQLRFDANATGQSVGITIPASEDRYDLLLYFTRGPSYGNTEILHDGEVVGRIIGYDKMIMPGGKVVLRNLKTEGNALPLKFVVTGKEAKSSGYSIGLDACVMEPIRRYIPDWYMIGPFPNPRDKNLKRLGLDMIFPPEKEFDTAKTYQGVNNQVVGWTLDKTPANGRMDLYKYNPFELVVVYVVTFVYSPQDHIVPLLLGSDDGVKVYVNDKEIHRVLMVRVAEPDQDRVPLSLKKGWNKLMLKIENNFGGYNFYARVLDPEQTLVFSPLKKM
jgi:hypothetical protein